MRDGFKYPPLQSGERRTRPVQKIGWRVPPAIWRGRYAAFSRSRITCQDELIGSASERNRPTGVGKTAALVHDSLKGEHSGTGRVYARRVGAIGDAVADLLSIANNKSFFTGCSVYS